MASATVLWSGPCMFFIYAVHTISSVHGGGGRAAQKIGVHMFFCEGIDFSWFGQRANEALQRYKLVSACSSKFAWGHPLWAWKDQTFSLWHREKDNKCEQICVAEVAVSHLCILKCLTACRWHPQLSSVCIVTAASGLICSKGSTMIALCVIQMVLFVTFGSIWIHLDPFGSIWPFGWSISRGGFNIFKTCDFSAFLDVIVCHSLSMFFVQTQRWLAHERMRSRGNIWVCSFNWVLPWVDRHSGANKEY